MWPQSGSKEESVSSKRWFADELRLCIVSLSLSLSFWKVAILHFTSLFWLFLIFGFFLSCVICTFTFLYIVFFSSWQSFPSHSFDDKFTNRTEIIWMEKYLDEYLDGRIFGWTKMLVVLWPIACVVPEEISINIDGQDFGHQLVDCPTQSD